MKRWWLLGIFGLLVALHGSAQQVIYANLKELVEDRGDTLSTLKIEKRSKNQILLMGGLDGTGHPAHHERDQAEGLRCRQGGRR